MCCWCKTCWWRYLETLTWEEIACSIVLISCALSRSVLSSKKGFSGFVKFQLGDFAVGCINWNLNLGTILLVSDDFLDMYAPSPSVHCKHFSDFTLNSFINTTLFDVDGVSLSDWDGSAVILGSELLVQVAAHFLSSNTAWCGEMSLSGLSSLAGHT